MYISFIRHIGGLVLPDERQILASIFIKYLFLLSAGEDDGKLTMILGRSVRIGRMLPIGGNQS